MSAAGDQLDGVIAFPFPDTVCADDEIDDRGEGDDVDALIELVELVGMDEVRDCFINDDQPGHRDEGSFDGGGEEFGFAVTVGVVFVAGFVGDMETVEADDTGDDVDGAFEGVGEDGDGLGEVVGGEFEQKEDDGDDGDPALRGDIFGAFCQNFRVVLWASWTWPKVWKLSQLRSVNYRLFV